MSIPSTTCTHRPRTAAALVRISWSARSHRPSRRPAVTAPVAVSATVNGERPRASVDAPKTLADFLRDDCVLTGTHLGCEHGVCGACTVLLDGAAVRSCLIFAVQADGADVTTIEGIAGPAGEL